QVGNRFRFLPLGLPLRVSQKIFSREVVSSGGRIAVVHQRLCLREQKVCIAVALICGDDFFKLLRSLSVLLIQKQSARQVEKNGRIFRRGISRARQQSSSLNQQTRTFFRLLFAAGSFDRYRARVVINGDERHHFFISERNQS